MISATCPYMFELKSVDSAYPSISMLMPVSLYVPSPPLVHAMSWISTICMIWSGSLPTTKWELTFESGFSNQVYPSSYEPSMVWTTIQRTSEAVRFASV